MRRQLILIPVLLLIPYFIRSQNYQIGDVIYNPDDCTKGVVFWINPDGSEGWMVALNDISIGCAWGINENIPSLDDLTGNNVHDRHPSSFTLHPSPFILHPSFPSPTPTFESGRRP